MQKSLFKKLFVVFTVLVMLFVLFACSPRIKEPDNGVGGGGSGDPNKGVSTPLDSKDMKALSKNVFDNSKKIVPADPDWFIVNIEASFLMENYITLPWVITEYSIVAKGNFHTKNNALSELFLEVRDEQLGGRVFGFYYQHSRGYVVLGESQYYIQEINISKIGKMLSEALTSSGVDINRIIVTLFADIGSGIPSIDKLLPIIAAIAFDKTKGTQTIYGTGDRMDISMPLKLNDVLGMLPSGIPGLLPDGIDYGVLGLPDLDPILKQFLGIDLATFKKMVKKPTNPALVDPNIYYLPQMKATFSLINSRMNDADGNIIKDEKGKDKYEYKGFNLNITTPITKDNPRNQYLIDINVPSLEMYTSSKKIVIDFAGLGMAQKPGDAPDSQYGAGGIFNFQTNLSLFINNSGNASFTLNDIIGSMIDLGSVGNIPLNLKPTVGHNYKFDIDIRADLDIFDGANNRAEITLVSDNKVFIKALLDGDVLYLDFSNVKSYYGQIIPNIKITNLDLTKIFFAEGGLLAGIMSFIDPYSDLGNAQNSASNAGDSLNNADAPTGFDFMKLMWTLFEYANVGGNNVLKNWTVNGSSLPTVVPDNMASILKLALDSKSLNQILGMFLALPEGGIGLEEVSISLDTRDIFNTNDSANPITINAKINEEINIGLQINSIGYLAQPKFQNLDMVYGKNNIETEEKKNSFLDVGNTTTFNATMEGGANLGMTATSLEQGGGLDLSGLISGVVDNLLLNFGIVESAGLSIDYVVKANLNLFKLDEIELLINVYINDGKAKNQPFLEILYTGENDTLYVNLEKMDYLKEALPALNFVGKLPKFKFTDIGLKAMLGGSTANVKASSAYNNIYLNNNKGYDIPETPDQLVSDFVNSMFINPKYVSEFGDEVANADGINILDLIGKAIDGIDIDTQILSLTVVLNAQLLQTLVGLLGLTATGLPDIKGSLQIQFKDVDEAGYIRVHLGILDGYDPSIEAIYFDLELIQNIKILIGQKNILNDDFVSSEYKELFTEVMEGMNISFEVGGNIKIDSDKPTYSNDYLNGLLAGLIKNLALQFNFGENLLDLNVLVQGNLVFGWEISEDGKNVYGVNFFESTFKVTVKDITEDKAVLTLYVQDNNLYLDLSYFGINNIGISDITKVIGGIGGGKDEPKIDQNNMIKTYKGNKVFDPYNVRNSANLSNAEAVGLQIWLAPDKVSLNITQDMIAALLSSFIGSELPVKFKNTNLEINTGDSLELIVDTGVEVLSLHLDAKIRKISIDPNDKIAIELSKEQLETYYMTKDGLPAIINVKLSGELGLNSELTDGNSNNIDLSPALKILLGDVGLKAVIQAFELKEKIYFSIDAAVNINSIADSEFRLVLETAGKDNQRKHVLTATYKNKALYIDTELFGIGKVKLENFIASFTNVQNATTENKGTSKLSAEKGTSKLSAENATQTYIDIMFVKGGISVNLTKDILISIIGGLDINAPLGLDISGYLEGINLDVDLSFGINPLNVKLGFNINEIEAYLKFNKLDIDFDKKIEVNESEFKVNEKFKEIGISLTGRLDMRINSGSEGVRLDFLIKKLLGNQYDFGVLIAAMEQKFGGSVYFNIDVMLDITNISNLNLKFLLTSSGNYEKWQSSEQSKWLGDIASLYILSEDGKLNAYIDLSGMGVADKLGIADKIVIEDIAGLVNSFSAPNTDPKTLAGKTPAMLPLDNNGQVSDADKLASYIILSIADPDKLKDAPIVVSIASGAIFALIQALGVNLEESLGDFNPDLGIEVGGATSWINILFTLNNENLSETKVVEIGISVLDVTINLAPSKSDFEIDKDEYFNINENDSVRTKISFAGTLNLLAKETDDKTDIDITNILKYYLADIDFGILIENLATLTTELHYNLEIGLDILKIAKGDFAGGLEAYFSFFSFDNGVKNELLSFYLINGTLYANLEKLNLGKLKIENVFGLLGLAPSNMALYEGVTEPVKNSSVGNNASLAGAYISIALTNSNGIVVYAAADVFRVIFTALGLPGDRVTQAVNEILAITLGIGAKDDIGESHIFYLKAEVANYKIEAKFSKLVISFRQTVISKPDGENFNASHYDRIDTNLTQVYVNLKFYLSWDMKDDTSFAFKTLIQHLGLNIGFDIAPLLTIIGAISSEFMFDVEGSLNFADLAKSNLGVVVYDVSDGESKKEEVMSIYFLDGNLYVDAECFNIQKVIIPNMVDFISNLLPMITGQFDKGEQIGLGNLANTNNDSENQSNLVSAYINVVFSPENVAINVSVTALFAVLKLVGLNVSPEAVNGISQVVEMQISASFLSSSRLAEIELMLISTDGYGVINRDKYVNLKLGLSNKFEVVLAKDKIPAILPKGGTADYFYLASETPTFGIKTSMYLSMSAFDGNLSDILDKEPLKSLLGTLIKDVVLPQVDIAFRGNHNFTIRMDILANVNPTDIKNLEAQINIYKVEGDKEYKLAQLNMFQTHAYVDTSPIGGPKFMIRDVMLVLVGEKDLEIVPQSSDTTLSDVKAKYVNNAEGDQKPEFNIGVELSKGGLLVLVNKQAFDLLLGLLGMNKIEIFESLDAELFIKPNGNNSIHLGAELKIGVPDNMGGSSKFLDIGLGLNGLRINFEPFTKDTDDKLDLPQSSDYLPAHTIDTLELKLSFEMNLYANEGQIEFGKIFEKLLGNSPLSNTLPNRLVVSENLGMTLGIDIHAILSFSDFLGGLQLRVKIYNKDDPSKFSLDIAYINGDIYIDGYDLGLEKVKIANVAGVFDTLLGKTASPVSDQQSYLSFIKEIESLYNSDNDDYLTEIAKSKAVNILLDDTNGLMILLGYEAIKSLLQMLNIDMVDQIFSDYLDGVISPRLSISVDPQYNINFELMVNGDVAENAGALGLKFKFVSSKMKINVLNDTFNGIESSIVPVISREERGEYISYDELTVYTDVNISLTIDTQEGILNVNEVLDMVIPGLKTVILFQEDQVLEVNIQGRIGIDFKKLLSRDYDSIMDSMVAEFTVKYTIYETTAVGTDTWFSQDVVKLYLAKGVIYINGEVLDSNLKLFIETVNIPMMIAELMNVAPQTPNSQSADDNNNVYNTNPYTMFAGLGNTEGVPLRSFVNLGSHGISLIVTTELINSLVNLIGLNVDISSELKSVMDKCEVGAFFDDGFALKFILSKKSAGEGYAGYDIELSILHDTKIDLKRSTYTKFYNEINSPENANEFASYYSINTMNNRITASVTLDLTADLKEYILDWSGLFSNEINQTTNFYIQIAEAMKGEVTARITVDLDFTNLDKLALDAKLELLNNDGSEILTLFFVGNLNNPTWNKTGPQVYLRAPSIGIKGLKLDAEQFKNFIALDLLSILQKNGMIDGNSPSAPSNGGAGSALNENSSNATGQSINFAELIDNISVSKGKIAIVVASTAIQSILSSLLNFPFDEVGRIALEISPTTNEIMIEINLDKAEDGMPSNIHFDAVIGKINVSIGPNNIFENDDFTDFVPLNEFKWEIEIDSQLLINDELGGLLDMSSLSAALMPGLGLALQSGENLNMLFDFKLKIFVDFGAFENIKFQLGVRYQGKVMAEITYIGSKDNGTIYANLSGLALPNIELSGINIGTMITDMLKNLTNSDASAAQAVAERSNEQKNEQFIDIKDVPFGNALLLLTASTKEVSLAITGALAQSLITGLNLGFTVPMFHSLKIGYSQEDDLAGLVIYLTGDSPMEQAFQIKYNFTNAKSTFDPALATSINPFFDANGKEIVFDDFSVINKIAMEMDMEIRLRTRKANGEKSEQLKSLEALLQGLLGSNDNSINIEPQDTIMVFEINLRLYIDLANLKDLSLQLSISYSGSEIVTIYYSGEKDAVYADLYSLGLFQAQISGIELMGLFSNLLSGVLTPGEGINLGDIISGGAGSNGASSNGASSSLSNSSNAAGNNIGDKESLIRIILGNDELTIRPDVEILGLFLPGFDIPQITDIRLSTKFTAGFNNLALNVKFDHLGNSLAMMIPEEGFRLFIGNSAATKKIKIPAITNSFGSINGINMGTKPDGSLAVGFSIVDLASSLMDSIKMKGLQIYIDKKVGYFEERDLGAGFGVPDAPTSPHFNPNHNAEAGFGASDAGYLENEYRRARLTIDKFSNNLININAAQLTNLIKDDPNRPKTARLYIKDSALKLALASSLILDLGGLNAIAGTIIGAILGGGDYGNPLQVGSIVDQATGGIQLALLFLPGMLGAGKETYVGRGSAYGQITDNDGKSVVGVEVDFGNGYTTVTDKDGMYNFVGLPAGEMKDRLDDFGNPITDSNGNTIRYYDPVTIYNYTLRKDGFFTKKGEVSITDSKVNAKKSTDGNDSSNVNTDDLKVTYNADKYNFVIIKTESLQEFNNITINVKAEFEDINGVISHGNPDLFLDYDRIDSSFVAGNFSKSYTSLTGDRHFFDTSYGDFEFNLGTLSALAIENDKFESGKDTISIKKDGNNFVVTVNVYDKGEKPKFGTFTVKIEGTGRTHDKDGNITIKETKGITDYEIWIRRSTDGVNFKTDTYDSWDNKSPINYATSDRVREDGTFVIDNLPFVDKDGKVIHYKFDVRSYTYHNMNLNGSYKFDEDNSIVRYEDTNGKVNLDQRLHWTQLENDVNFTMLQRIRIRLGADILDGGSTNPSDPGYNDGGAGIKDNYTTGYETGYTDAPDGISYIELWLDPEMISGLFGMVHGFLLNMMGVAQQAPDQRNNFNTLSYTGKGSLVTSEDMSKSYGVFQEDRSIYFYNFVNYSKEAYQQSADSAGAKLPGGLIAFALSGALGKTINNLLAGNIAVVGGIIRGITLPILKDATKLLSHLLPFVTPYSLIGNQTSKGNPLQDKASINNNDNGQSIKSEFSYLDFVNGKDVNGVKNKETGNFEYTDGGNKVVRTVSNFELSMYVKLTLNNHSEDAKINRITLFANGATYANATQYNQIHVNGKCPNWKDEFIPGLGYQYEDAMNKCNCDWKPNGFNLELAQTVTNGSVNEELEAKIQAWIKKNNVNSYIVIEDYKYENVNGITVKTIYNRMYVRDMQKNAKDDRYMELDINNTGIRLRQGTVLGEEFFNVKSEGLSTARYNMKPPTRIQFHNPYNLSDFTMYGGTWASEEGGVRRNTDPNASVIDFLPNRNMLTFSDGSSTESSGVHVYWDLSKIIFNQKGTDFNDPVGKYFAIGHCLNLVYGKDSQGIISKIRVDVDPFVIDTTTINEFKNIPTIDPYTYNETEFMKQLPKQFTYRYEKTYVINGAASESEIQSLVFNNLKWSIDESKLSATAGGTQYIDLEYSVVDVNSNQSIISTVKVPVKVINRSIISVSGNVTNSDSDIYFGNIDNVPGQHNIVKFNPLINSNPKADLEALPTLNVTTTNIVNSGNGNINEVIKNWEIVERDVSALDNFDSLAENHPIGGYKVYFKLKDNFGTTQTVEVRVLITSRKIDPEKTIAETGFYKNSDKAIKITPFVKDDLRSKLPANMTVVYKNNYSEIFKEVSSENAIEKATDFCYLIPNLNHIFDNSTDLTKTVDVQVVVGKDKARQTFNLKVEVQRNTPINVENIIVNPFIYEESGNVVSINNNQIVNYNTKTSQGVIGVVGKQTQIFFLLDNTKFSQELNYTADKTTIDGVNFYNNILITQPTFDGKIFFLDVAIIDPEFGVVVIPNVNFVLRRTFVESINIPSDTIVNPYNADKEINNIFFDKDNNTKDTLTLNAYQIGSPIGSDYFDVISWRYQDANGLRSDGVNANIIITVGNKGFADGNEIWHKEISLTLNVKDMEVMTLKNNVIEVADPFDPTSKLPTEVTGLDRNGNEIQVPIFKFDAGTKLDRLYMMSEIYLENGLILGSEHQNTQKTFSVTIKNMTPRQNIVVEYLDESGNVVNFNTLNLNAFDRFALPKKANVTFEDGIITEMDVAWQSIDNYNSAVGGEVNATAIIGNKLASYRDTVTFNVQPQKITDYKLPTLIKIDPYQDLKTQVMNQLGEWYVMVGETKYDANSLSVFIPNIKLSYVEDKYSIYKFGFGISNNFGNVGGNENFVMNVFEEIEIEVLVEERIAVAINTDKPISGNIYNKINFEKDLSEVEILFRDGETINVKDVKWNVSTLRYYMAGGIFTVKATIGKGEMEQVIDVTIYVNSVQVASVTSDVEHDGIIINDGKISTLVVDPLIGFVNYPSTLTAKFFGSEETALVNVDWSFNKIDLSIQGGEFNVSNNRSAQAIIYVLEKNENGEMVRVGTQVVNIPVTVLDRHITSVSVSKVIDGDDETFTEITDNNLSFNAYEDVYNELFSSADFAFYRRVRVDYNGVVKTFELSESSYRIYDKATGSATNINNLYLGKDVYMRMSYGLQSTGIAKDAFINHEFNVTIVPVVFSNSENVKSEWLIDVYGIDTNRSTAVDAVDGLVTIYTEGGLQIRAKVSYNKDDINWSFDEFNRRKSQINYKAGEGRLYATFTSTKLNAGGAPIGGAQTVTIPVKYADRTVSSDFTSSVTPLFDSAIDGVSIYKRYGETTKLVIDPFKVTIYEPKQEREENVDNLMDLLPDIGSVNFVDQSIVKSKVAIKWNISKVMIYNQGGEFIIEGTIGKGESAQTIKYPLRVLDRRVKAGTDSNGKPNGFDDLFIDGADNFKIKVYEYLGIYDLVNELAEKVFTAVGNRFTVHFNDEEFGAFPIEYVMGGNATAFTHDGITLPISKEESNKKTNVTMDPGMMPNYMGRLVKFYVNIPGYASGVVGGQKASVLVKSESQFIVEVKEYDNKTGVTIDEFKFNDRASGLDTINGVATADAISKSTKPGFDYYIEKPYHFIENKGLELPSYVRFKTVDENGKVNSPDGGYVYEPYWKGSSNNFMTVHFDGRTLNTGFTLDDGQNYKLTIGVDAWVLGSDVLFEENNSSYAEKEVILLPKSNKLAPIYQADYANGKLGIYDESSTGTGYGYRFTFANGQVWNFGGIGGGGTNSKADNKWNFENVDFSIGSAFVQAATLRLSGRGGQTLYWKLKTQERSLLNNSIIDFYALNAENGSVNNTAKLPKTYKQYFANNKGSTEIPVSYSNFEASTGSGNEDGSFSFDGNTNEVKALKATPATGGGIPYTIEWDATELRAYPNPNESIGGKIKFVAYGNMYEAANGAKPAGEVDNTRGAKFIYHPDSPNAYGSIRPGVDSSWKYPSDLTPYNAEEGSTTGTSGYIVGSDGTQSNIPVILLKQGTMFKASNLPIYSLIWYRADYFDILGVIGGSAFKPSETRHYYTGMPWQNAKVYFSKNWTSNNYGEVVRDGVAGIRAENGNIGGKYTIVVEMTGNKFGGANSTITVVIQIVEDIVFSPSEPPELPI